jgi:hypothetical protein
MRDIEVKLERDGFSTRLSVDIAAMVQRMTTEERLELAATIALSGEVCKQVIRLVIDRYPENGDWLGSEAVEAARQEIWARADEAYRDSVSSYAAAAASAARVNEWYASQLFRMERHLRACLQEDEHGYYYTDKFDGTRCGVTKDQLQTVPPMTARGTDFAKRDAVLEALGMVGGSISEATT